MPAEKSRFGALEPHYQFALNPYPDIRVSTCPLCDRRTGQRKLPLVIHVDPARLIFLNYTCRYCASCELLVANRHKIEHLLTQVFTYSEPDLIGNWYLILGTMEKPAWRAGQTQPWTPQEARAHIHDFAHYRGELGVTQTGWFPEGKQPPLRPAPASTEWVKPSRLR